MRTFRRETTSFFLLLLLLGCVGFVLWQGLRWRGVRRRLSEVENHRETLSGQAALFEKVARTATNAARSSRIAVNPRSTSDHSMFDDGLRQAAQFIHARPELESLYHTAELGSIQLSYAPFFRALNLPASAQAQIAAVLVARAQGILDLEAESLGRGENLGQPSVQRQIDSQTDTSTAQLRALLGPTGYGQFQQYESTVNLRMFVGELAGSSYYDQPLTAEQGDRLAGALADAIPAGAPVDPMLVVPSEPILPSPPGADWDAALAAAGKILSPEQLARFRVLAELHKQGPMH